jgi:hypothetical protein
VTPDQRAELRSHCGCDYVMLTSNSEVKCCNQAMSLIDSRKRNRDFSPTIRHNPIDGFQASLLIKLEKLDWGSILDNKSDGHAR